MKLRSMLVRIFPFGRGAHGDRGVEAGPRCIWERVGPDAVCSGLDAGAVPPLLDPPHLGTGRVRVRVGVRVRVRVRVRTLKR